jgi:hypothetical protein
MDYTEQMEWFTFALGAIGFGGFVIILRDLAKAAPKALVLLSQQISDMNAELSAQEAEKAKMLRELIKEVGMTKGAMRDALQGLAELKHQHEHADNFNFGTSRTNKLLESLTEKVIRLDAKISVLDRCPVIRVNQL